MAAAWLRGGPKMKIEIDTKSDSKEELMHLANMLHALSGSRVSVSHVRHSAYDAPKSKNIFDDPSPSVGLFGMFGDTASPSTQQSVSQDAYPQPVSASSQPSQASSGGLFSIFNSASSSAQSGVNLDETDSENKTSSKDILDDPRIVPY